MDDISRRAVLAASAVLPWAATGAGARGDAATSGGGARTLVAYFTRSGNTRVIAGTVHRELKTALFEIRPAQAYPEDYEQTVEQVQQETRRGYEPPLAGMVPDISSYETVFLGTPVWGTTAPPVIRSFLRAHDLDRKTIRPFITHGGYGPGDSLAVIRAHARGATVAEPFVLECDQERRTLAQVRGWLGSMDDH